MWPPIITCSVGFSLVAAAALWRPQGTRLFLGFFFLAMGLGVNLGFTVFAPEGYANMAGHAYIPLARSFFEGPVAAHPRAWMTPVIVLETFVGIALLMRGRIVRVGLIAGAVLITGIALIGWEMVPNLILAAAMLYLASLPADLSLVDRARAWSRPREDGP